MSEKAMAMHSSTLAWKIPWTGEPGGRQSIGSQRVWHNWATLLHSLNTLSLEKGMATHSSILAWGIPWTEEPGRPWSMGSQRVGHDWSDWVRTHVLMWELDHKEGWVLRIDSFNLWCWRRLLRAPWRAKRSNQSILRKSTLNIHWKDWCWSSNTLATWCEESTSWKRHLMLGKIEGSRRREWQRMRSLDSITDSVDTNLSKLQETVEDRGTCCAAVHGAAGSQTRLSDWTTTAFTQVVQWSRILSMQEMQEMWFWSLDWEDPWSKKWQSAPVFLPGTSHR